LGSRPTRRNTNIRCHGKKRTTYKKPMTGNHKLKRGIRNFDRKGTIEGRATTETLRAEPKVGRNDPCPCGSGKKYKKCCKE